jgi:hypothetical protein
MTYVISDGKEDTNPVIQELFNNTPRKGPGRAQSGRWITSPYMVSCPRPFCDGGARTILDQHKGKGAETYAALRGTYASEGKVQSRAMATHRKLESLRYTGRERGRSLPLPSSNSISTWTTLENRNNTNPLKSGNCSIRSHTPTPGS